MAKAIVSFLSAKVRRPPGSGPRKTAAQPRVAQERHLNVQSLRAVIATIQFGGVPTQADTRTHASVQALSGAFSPRLLLGHNPTDEKMQRVPSLDKPPRRVKLTWQASPETNHR